MAGGTSLTPEPGCCCCPHHGGYGDGKTPVSVPLPRLRTVLELECHGSCSTRSFYEGVAYHARALYRLHAL